MKLTRQTIALSIVLVSILYFALAYGIYAGLTSRVLGANDFYSRWVGARALFLRGENPYSDAVTREIQTGMYGRLAHPDEDQVAYAYPIYTAFTLAPLVNLPYAQAQALWMAFLVFCVVGGTLALARLFEIPLRPFILGAIIFGALFFYPSVRGIFNGQFALVSFFCLTLAMLMIRADADVIAGILLALATVKPQPAIFLEPAIILWAIVHRRWKIVAASIAGIFALVAVGLLFVPTWLFDFVMAIQNYSQYLRVGPPVQTLSEMLFPQASSMLTYASSLALVVWMTQKVVRNRQKAWQDFSPTLGLVALVTTLMAGRVGTPDQILLLIVWLGWFGEKLERQKIVWVVFAALTILILPWLVFFATLRGDSEHVVVTLVLPFLTLAAYFWREWANR